MTATGLTFGELLLWNQEASDFWKRWLEANPAVLALPCDIGRAHDVLGLVRHIWAVDLVWARRVSGLEPFDRETVAQAQLEALFAVHLEARGILRTVLDDSGFDWDYKLTMDVPWLTPELKHPTRRKALGHALMHAPRHWAQLATLVRIAGFPSEYKGDLLLSSALA
jgi:uncharacterized damage-inducible protein DinB